jgi:hypothetical protein
MSGIINPTSCEAHRITFNRRGKVSRVCRLCLKIRLGRGEKEIVDDPDSLTKLPALMGCLGECVLNSEEYIP